MVHSSMLGRAPASVRKAAPRLPASRSECMSLSLQPPDFTRAPGPLQFREPHS